MNQPAPGGLASDLRTDNPLSSSVLVLNKHYMALRVVNARRAFVLLFKEYAEAIDAENGTFVTYDITAWIRFSHERATIHIERERFVHTPRMALAIPRVIRLVNYDRMPRREVRFSRKSIMARDENRCQYCGRRLAASQLSLDHVIPKSRGGKSSWTNVVAACHPCNTRKGGRLPTEASMNLLRIPGVPKRNPLIADKLRFSRYDIWKQFLSDGEGAVDS